MTDRDPAARPEKEPDTGTSTAACCACCAPSRSRGFKRAVGQQTETDADQKTAVPPDVDRAPAP